MKIQSCPNRCRTLVTFLVTLLWCSFPNVSRSQDAEPAGARNTDCDVGLTYHGRNGLKNAAPKDSSILEHVHVCYRTKLTAEDVIFLSTLERVEELSFGGNLNDEYVSIEGSLAPLGEMKRLRRVFLCKQDMRDKDLEFIAKLPSIEILEFLGDTNPYGKKGPAVTDECAEYLCQATTLRDLCIYGGGKLTDRFVSVIARDLKNLEHLTLDSQAITDQSLQMLADGCRNLRSLRLYSNHFTDKGVGFLASAQKLEMLSLGSASLRLDCIKSFSGLINLQHLELTVPTIDDGGVQTLTGLPALEILALREPTLSDDQFAMFANHATLQSAFLIGRDLSTTKVIEVMKTIPKLNHLDVGVNKDLQTAVNQFLKNRKLQESK